MEFYVYCAYIEFKFSKKLMKSMKLAADESEMLVAETGMCERRAMGMAALHNRLFDAKAGAHICRKRLCMG